jgi:hypothetical protein
MANTLVTEMVKNSPEYRVEAADGTVVARSHCVQEQLRLFTVVVGGKWSGVLPEAEAVAVLQGMR